MAKTLLSGANIVYNGNPLNDLSLVSFLDKFMEKKPKERNWHGGSQIEPAKQLDMSRPLIGADILQLDEMDIAPEDVIFHKFYMNKMNSAKKPKKKKKKDADDEAAEDLIGEVEDDDSDNEEIDAILDSTTPALDAEEYDYDDLDRIVDEDDDDLAGNASDDGMEFPADMAEDDDVADANVSDDDVSIGDAEDGSDDEEDIFEVKPKKRKGKGKAGASPFASLEDYEHLLEDNDDENENKNEKDSKKRKKSKKTRKSKPKRRKASTE